MKLLLDTNILLDTLLNRSGAQSSAEVIATCSATNQGFIAWHGLATVYYLVLKAKSAAPARSCIRTLLAWAKVAGTGHVEALRALDLHMADFEDAMQVAAAEACGAAFIITRNGVDFTNSPVPALTPEEFRTRFP